MLLKPLVEKLAMRFTQGQPGRFLSNFVPQLLHQANFFVRG